MSVKWAVRNKFIYKECTYNDIMRLHLIFIFYCNFSLNICMAKHLVAGICEQAQLYYIEIGKLTLPVMFPATCFYTILGYTAGILWLLQISKHHSLTWSIVAIITFNQLVLCILFDSYDWNKKQPTPILRVTWIKQ